MIFDWLYEALGVNGNIRVYPGAGKVTVMMAWQLFLELSSEKHTKYMYYPDTKDQTLPAALTVNMFCNMVTLQSQI